jgi:hypothetical protein
LAFLSFASVILFESTTFSSPSLPTLSGVKTFEATRVGDALEEAFQRHVDLVTEDSISPYIAPHIVKDLRYVDLAS